jgi:hypothetical protein
VIFVDTNVFMYAVGREHPLREPAGEFFREAIERHVELCTSAEVLQELLHAYLPVSRLETFDAAMRLAVRTTAEIWTVESEDVEAARSLVDDFVGLGARDLLHVACCRRRGVAQIKTYDRALAAALHPK